MGSGLTVHDLDAINRRLTRVEDALYQLGLTSPDSSGGRVGGRPPAISGLTLTAQVDRIRVEWNAVNIADLKRYEVQVSSAASMASPETFYTTTNHFTYEGGNQGATLTPTLAIDDTDLVLSGSSGTGTTKYIRVRVQNRSDRVSPWSGTLNTTTGVINTGGDTLSLLEQIITDMLDDLGVTTGKIADDAVTIPASAYTSGSVTLPAAGTETDLQSVTLTSTGAPILVIVNLQFIRGDSDDAITFKVYRDSTVLATWAATASASLLGTMAFVIEDTPGSGSVTYKVTGSEVGDSDGSAQQRAMYCLEVKK